MSLKRLFLPSRKVSTVLKYGLLIVVVSSFIIGIWMIVSEPLQIKHHLPVNDEDIEDSFIGAEQVEELEEQSIIRSQKEAVRKIIKRPRKDVVLGVPAKPVQSSEDIKFDQEIAADEAKLDPKMGRDGSAAFLPAAEQQKAEEIRKTAAFNLMLSDRIPYNRTIPGTIDFSAKISYLVLFLN